jgi:hypothetical protein
MAKLLTLSLILSLTAAVLRGGELLIVADEIPAMELLAGHIRMATGLIGKIVAPSAMPDDLSAYRAVVDYIHKDMAEATEKKFINYAKNGGKLILLHHSISSGKRKNKDWFPFLDIKLPPGDLDAGGYNYYSPVSFDLVNLAPTHYITTHDVQYDGKVPYVSSRTHQKANLPATKLTDTEVYVNHRLSGERTILLGVKYRGSDGLTLMQYIAGWLKQTEKGMVIYFMPGHRGEDFNNSVYRQILINAVMYQPFAQTSTPAPD